MSYVVEQLSHIRAEVAELRSQQVRYLEAPVTAIDPATSTFTVTVAGQEGGAAVPLSGIAAPPQFLPQVGSPIRLGITGAQPVYMPSEIAEHAVSYRELGSAVVYDIDYAVTTSTSASGAASQAQESATTALTAANGKNRVIYSVNAPTASTPGTQVGDSWFRRDAAGVIIGSWEWNGAEWQVRTYGNQVIGSITAGKITTGTLTAVVTLSGTIQTAASGPRVVHDINGIRLFGSGATPTVELNANTGNAIFRGTVEGALFRTSGSGQRLEIMSGSRAVTFYPAAAGGLPGVLESIDDGSGHAGMALRAGGGDTPGHGFVNLASTFADIAHTTGGANASFIRVDATGIGISVKAGARASFTTDQGVDFYSGALRWGQLNADGSMRGIIKFAGGGNAFSFGVDPGNINADIYALRFISSNAGATGGFVYFSDKRLKKNIRESKSPALAKVLSTPVHEFEWNETGETAIGFVAQEVPAEAQVHLSPEDVDLDGIPNPIGISSEQMLVTLWKAVQEIAHAR